MSELQKALAFNIVLLETVHDLKTELMEYRSQDPMIAHDMHAYIHVVSFEHTTLPHTGMILNDIVGLNLHDLESFFPTMSEDIKRGDLISNADESGYRASGVYIFDGHEVQPLSINLDEHGHIPPEFCIITEFTPGFWHANGFDDRCMRYIGIDENTKPDLYWHSEPEIEFINLKKLGIEKQFREINDNWGDLEDASHIIDFMWHGKRYLLLVSSSTVWIGGILLVRRMGIKETKKMNIDHGMYAYIMRTE
jgi:hypothetical protein